MKGRVKRSRSAPPLTNDNTTGIDPRGDEELCIQAAVAASPSWEDDPWEVLYVQAAAPVLPSPSWEDDLLEELYVQATIATEVADHTSADSMKL